MKLILFLFFLALSGCMLFVVGIGSETYIDYTFWTMREEIPLDSMISDRKLRTDGFYKKTGDRGSYPNVFYLTRAGYFVYTDAIEIATKSYRDFTSFHQQWGRFQLTNDSIEIQYFHDTNIMRVTNGILRRYDLAADIGRGVVPSDTTLLIYERVSWCSVGCDSIRSYTQVYNPPLKYHFVKSDTLPPSDNWIKHLDYKKNKLE